MKTRTYFLAFLILFTFVKCGNDNDSDFLTSSFDFTMTQNKDNLKRVFVNKVVNLQFDIDKKDFVPKDRWEFSYKMLKGTGIMLSADGKITYQSEKKYFLGEGDFKSFKVKYKGTKAGENQIRVTVYNKKFTHEAIVNIKQNNRDLSFTADVPSTSINPGEKVPVTINIIGNSTYQVKLTQTKGTGSIVDAKNKPITPKFYPVTTQTLIYRVSYKEIGDASLKIEVKDIHGKTETKNLDFTVADLKFNVTITYPSTPYYIGNGYAFKYDITTTKSDLDLKNRTFRAYFKQRQDASKDLTLKIYIPKGQEKAENEKIDKINSITGTIFLKSTIIGTKKNVTLYFEDLESGTTKDIKLTKYPINFTNTAFSDIKVKTNFLGLEAQTKNSSTGRHLEKFVNILKNNKGNNKLTIDIEDKNAVNAYEVKYEISTKNGNTGALQLVDKKGADLWHTTVHNIGTAFFDIKTSTINPYSTVGTYTITITFRRKGTTATKKVTYFLEIKDDRISFILHNASGNGDATVGTKSINLYEKFKALARLAFDAKNRVNIEKYKRGKKFFS